jgi:hypothetical protein
VITGHDNGVITINLAKADDAERERRRHQMGLSDGALSSPWRVDLTGGGKLGDAGHEVACHSGRERGDFRI